MLRVTREVPFPWLVGLVAVGIANAAVMYYKQSEQDKKLSDLLSEIRQLSASVSQGNLKDVEHDLKIADIQRRLIALETKK
jgi:predicted transcriptional regulator